MDPKTQFDLELYDNAYPPGIENNYWHIARNRLIDSFLPRGKDAVLLEIGCGPGIVVDYLRKQGRDCWGCDLGLARPATEAVRPYLMLERDAFTLDENFRKSVSTLLLLDMLEHIPNPVEFLKKCREYFPNAGSVLITLPARQELWSVYDEYFGHFLRYDLPGAQAMLVNAGFKPSVSRYFFHSIYIPMRALALIKVQRSTKNRAPNSVVAKLVHRLIGLAMYIEAKLLPGRIPGSSIVSVAEPDALSGLS